MKIKKMSVLYIVLGIIVTISFFAVVFLNRPQFGKLPTGERLERIKKSAHYKNGEWQNEVPTMMMTGNGVAVILDYLFGSHPRTRPEKPVKSVKTDINSLPKDVDWMIWFGHSSYLLQLSGKRILVDPVLVSASPLPWFNKPYEGSDIYKPEDMPDIDYMLISHDHWDHLDYDTQMALRSRVAEVVVPLGVGEHFEYWGFPKEHITDLDWYEHKSFTDGFTFHQMPARHFSGRALKGNQALWGSFVIESPDGKHIFVGGDSGYAPHFKKIGQRFPKMNLAILENGQYDKTWAQIHTLPEQLPNVMDDLGALQYVTVHHGKFCLSNHPWDEPLQNEKKAAQKTGNKLSVLEIGSVLYIN